MKKMGLKCLKNQLPRLILQARDFIQNHLPLFVQLHGRKRAAKGNVCQELDGPFRVLVALRRGDPCVLFGGEGIDFSPH